MDDESRIAVLKLVVKHIPREFWADFGSLARQTYKDCFQQVSHDNLILPEQKLDWLYQYRHFRMEQLLHAVAIEQGLSSSATILVENNRRYVFVARGSIALTQAYVPAMQDMPKPARFRERHSSMNAVSGEGRLELGDQPVELLRSKKYFGIISHNPVGRRFEEGLQALGMIQFSVPEIGCASWIIQLTFQEILSAYDAVQVRKPASRDLAWKKIPKTKEDNGD